MPAPVNDVAPALTGTATVGQTLTCSQGTWTTTGSTTYAYQWEASKIGGHPFESINGARSRTYIVANSDIDHLLRCKVTATNQQGSTVAYSNEVGEVPPFGFFTPEDGTGLVNANSYTTIAEADAYHALRNNTAWLNATQGAKETALVLATDFIEVRWGHRFKGERQFPDTPQNLSFPRLYIGEDGAVPLAVQRACAEYALRQITAPLAPDPTFESNGKTLSAKRTKVGPIETDLTYTQSGPGSVAPTFRPYPAADALLRPYLLPSGGNRVIR
jgi:hypothetical protein